MLRLSANFATFPWQASRQITRRREYSTRQTLTQNSSKKTIAINNANQILVISG